MVPRTGTRVRPWRRRYRPRVELPATTLVADFFTPETPSLLALLTVFLAAWFKSEGSLLVGTAMPTTIPRYRVAAVRALGGWPHGRLFPADPAVAAGAVGDWLALLMSLNYEGVFIEPSAEAALRIGDDIIHVHTTDQRRARRFHRGLSALGVRHAAGFSWGSGAVKA